MVISTSSIFASRFNQCIISRKRTFSVPATNFIDSILSLLYHNGYIFSYTFSANNTYLVVPNLKAISFTFEVFSSSSVLPSLTTFKIKKFSTSGLIFIVNTPHGLQFSDTLLINRSSGRPLFTLRYLNK